MKCLHCMREIRSGQGQCPHCRKQIQPNSYSTITETAEAMEQQSRRRLLQQVLQFSLVATTFIALASFVRFDPPKASPLPPESLRSSNGNAPLAQALTPLEAKPLVTASKPDSALRSQSLSLLSAEDLRLINSGAGSPVRASVGGRASIVLSAESAATKSPAVAKTARDEAATKKLATPIAPAMTPPASAPLVANSEAEPRLEVDAASVLLPANAGLVTINSYVPARIYINGVYSGSTPRSVKLLAGEHTINLLAEGYHEYSRKIKIAGKQQVGILASLSKK